jgi:hypothetical protein
LRRTAPRDRTAGSRPTRAESEKARRQGRSEPPRIALRRVVSAAAVASSEDQEFFARLEQAGVVVRKRFSTRNPGQVTGYAVALPTDTAGSGGPVWYSGGKLAPDLTLPKLRHRWNGQTTGPAEGPAAPLTSAERAAIWDHVTRTAATATEQIRHLSVTDPGLAADAAWAAADTFHAAATALGSRVLRQAADSYAPGGPRSVRARSAPDPGGGWAAPGGAAAGAGRARCRRSRARPDRADRPPDRPGPGGSRSAGGAASRGAGRCRPRGGGAAAHGPVRLRAPASTRARPRTATSRCGRGCLPLLHLRCRGPRSGGGAHPRTRVFAPGIPGDAAPARRHSIAAAAPRQCMVRVTRRIFLRIWRMPMSLYEYQRAIPAVNGFHRQGFRSCLLI